MMRKFLIGLLALVLLIVAAFFISPWPGVFLIRTLFDRGAAEASQRLAPLVPASVRAETHAYDGEDLALDIYRPAEAAHGPTIVWIHGGGFVSGRRGDIENYLRILAAKGFVVVNVDYTIAPEAAYPTPIRQVNAALAFLAREGQRLGVDPTRLVLAGDSAGAQISAQVAAMLTNPAYAQRLGIPPAVPADSISGALLFCGVYDISGMGKGGGILGQFVHVTGWAYSGKRDWRQDETFATMTVAPWLTPAFPPAFVSAGNADPLGPQSVALAQALAAQGVPVEELFFPNNYTPPLAHEYQFDITTQAGEQALSRATAWLNGL